MAGSVDYFLKIDGIEGESKDAKHKNEIELAVVVLERAPVRLPLSRRRRRRRQSAA